MVKNYLLTCNLKFQRSTLNFVCLFFFFLFFVFSTGVKAQTINNVKISSNSVCKPSTINVTFQVNNGNGSQTYFTNATNYIIRLGTLSGTTFTFVYAQNYPAPSNFPSRSNGAVATITKSLSIPDTVPDGIIYQVLVSATVPTAGSTFSSLSPIFEVKSTVSPTVSNNGPICSGNPLSLTASSSLGATYSWTGPNGFASSQQNPVVSTSATVAMSGIYSLVITGINGCSSNPSTTNVVVSFSGGWTGTVNSDWNNPSNWGCNMIPNLNTNVMINSGLSNYPILNTGAIGTVKNINLQAGASLKILNNTLEIAGSISNNGSIDALNGNVTFKGTAFQNIPANTFLTNQIKNLTINNPTNVDLLGLLEITGIVKALTGNLNSGGFLKLVSNNIQTALIDGSGNGLILGSVTMQRYIDPAFGYKYFSTPFQNTTVGDYQATVNLTATFPNFYRYVENRKDSQNRAATGFESYTTSTGSVDILTGYALNFGGTSVSKTVEISGTLNNGNQQVHLTHNNGLYTKGFNLVGNPYPSPIDWNAASGWTKTNVDDAIYFFTASTGEQYKGIYSSYVNGVQSGGGSSGNIIPSMQGFFVHVTDSPTNTYPVTANLGTTNLVRITNFDQPFYKSPEEENFNLIRLNAKFDNLPLSDETVIYFNRNASEDFDRDLDALKLLNTNNLVPNFYTISSNEKMLSINAVPSNFNAEILRIPLGFDVENEGWISISLSHENQFTANAISI